MNLTENYSVDSNYDNNRFSIPFSVSGTNPSFIPDPIAGSITNSYPSSGMTPNRNSYQVTSSCSVSDCNRSTVSSSDTNHGFLMSSHQGLALNLDTSNSSQYHGPTIGSKVGSVSSTNPNLYSKTELRSKSVHKSVSKTKTKFKSAHHNHSKHRRERSLKHKQKGSYNSLILDSSKNNKMKNHKVVLQSNADNKVQGVKDILGSCLLNHITKLKTPILRRPFLASLLDTKPDVARKSVEKAIGHAVNSAEWTRIKIHAKYPGSFNPVEPSEIHRFRVPRNVLLKLLRYIESPGNAQRYAFGTKVLSLLGGNFCQLENVSL